MFQNPRKTPGTGSLRYLNQPQEVRVKTDSRGLPVAIIQGRRRVRIMSVADLWEISDEWWRETPVYRRYYQVSLVNGKRLTLFQDLVGGGWYVQNA